MKTAANLKDSNGFQTEIVFEGQIEGYDVLTMDLAGTEDGESYWQIRQSYISKAGKDEFVPLAFGDGYNGFDVGKEDMSGDDYSVLTVGLGIDEETARELVETIGSEVGLASTNFDLANEMESGGR